MVPIKRILGYVRLTRPQNALAAALTYSVGYFFNSTSSLSISFITGLIIILLLHSMATVDNDIQDLEIDLANKRRSALQNKSISVQNAKLFVQTLGLTALLIALLFPPRLINTIVVFVFLFFTWLYNMPPYLASRRPISSILILGLCYGQLPIVYGFVLASGGFDKFFIVFAILWFFVRVSISIMKDYKDSEGDKLFNKQTFYLHFGGKVTAIVSLAFSSIAYLGIVTLLFISKGTSTSFGITLILSGLLALRNIKQRIEVLRVKDEKKLTNIFSKSFIYHNQFEAAVLLCLIFSLK